jgi:MoaA/NifB/PqqE/SkfB family radical SAM enzyme
VYKSSEIKSVHLEITEACNASCPMCARNINGGEDNPHLKDNELSLDIK